MVGPKPDFFREKISHVPVEKSPNRDKESVKSSKIEQVSGKIPQATQRADLSPKPRSFQRMSAPGKPESKAAQLGKNQLAPVRPGSSPGVMQVAQTPKPFSGETLKIVRETDWSMVEVSGEESQDYMLHLNRHTLDRDSHALMRPASSVQLSNGKTLTAGEHAALTYYTQHGYQFVNALLTNSPNDLYHAANKMKINLQPESEKEILMHCRMICSALNKLPPSNSEELYRGALLTTEQLEGYWQSFKNKEVLHEAQIMSTTVDMGVAGRFIQIKKQRVAERYQEALQEAQKTGLPAPKKPNSLAVLFAIKQKNGAKDVQAYSHAPDELEATYVAGTKFKVAKVLDSINLPPHLQEIYEHVIILEKV
ncbi:MAG: hypothetical protein LLG04_16855 [Parachlamydia sp.]|nr:hypothetical protein [Parachlamydia sp.]